MLHDAWKLQQIRTSLLHELIHLWMAQRNDDKSNVTMNMSSLIIKFTTFIVKHGTNYIANKESWHAMEALKLIWLFLSILYYTSPIQETYEYTHIPGTHSSQINTPTSLTWPNM